VAWCAYALRLRLPAAPVCSAACCRLRAGFLSRLLLSQADATASGNTWQAAVLYSEDAAMLSFDDQGSELLAVTEQECLVYMHRGSS
jgi:hypothetical protein